MEQSFTSQGIVADTRRGLLDDPKWLSSLYFYDARGSALFERICQTPEYYPTRTESAILRDHAKDIAAAAPARLVGELGSGSSTKTEALLDALLEHGAVTYVPVDVSDSILSDTVQRLTADRPALEVRPFAGEYAKGLSRIGATPPSPRLVLFLGSSIGNFEPHEQEALLRTAHDALAPGDAFLLGTDLVKDVNVLEAAYNDAAGVTAAFNRNILTHLHRELGGADDGAFRHVALWDGRHSRIEMHLESEREQVLHFPDADLHVPVAKGERIHTENSYKFTLPQVEALAGRAGWRLERTWMDAHQWFAVHLLRRA